MYNISCVTYELVTAMSKKPLPYSLNYIRVSSGTVFNPIVMCIIDEIRDNIRGGLRDIDIIAAKTLMINGEL